MGAVSVAIVTVARTVFLLLPLQLMAQSLTVKDFLSGVLDDPAYVSFDVQESVFDKRGSYALPWVPSLEFRTRNNELLDNRQQYALRADVGNPWQIQSNYRYFKGIRSAKGLEQQILLKRLLRERYDLVLEYWYSAERVTVMKKLKELRQQISAAMAQRSGSADFDAEQYLNSELDVVTKTADLQEAAFERDLVLSRIMQLGGKTGADLDLSRMMDADGVRSVISRPDTGSNSAVEVALLQQEIANSEQKIRTDKLNFDLGFVQGMYAPYRADRGDGVFGLAAGVTIPLFNQNRDDIARERLKIIERKGALDQIRRREEGRRQAEASIVSSQIQHYTVIDSLSRDLRKRQLNLPATLSKNYNPVVELKYQEKLVELDLLKLRFRREILRQYLSFLDNSGQLHQRPLVNYLDRGLDRLEE